MTRFAERTKVPVDRTRTEIEKTLMRYGATGYMSGWSGNRAMIGFEMHDRRIKFILPLPERKQFDSKAQFEQATRTYWRAFALVIKAKLEAVASGVAVFEEEFMAQIVMPDGQTVSEHAMPMIQQAYETNTVPPLLPHLQ